MTLDNDTHIRLALYGHQFAGKTSTADLIGQKMEEAGGMYRRVSFAGPLRQEIASALATKEYPKATILAEMTNERTKAKWRTVMQFWGTEIRRNIFGSDYWVNQLDLFEPEDQPSLIIVDDMRFDNEMKALRAAGFLLARLSAKGNTENVTRHQHASEVEWKRWTPDKTFPWHEDQQVKTDAIWEWLLKRA